MTATITLFLFTVAVFSLQLDRSRIQKIKQRNWLEPDVELDTLKHIRVVNVYAKEPTFLEGLVFDEDKNVFYASSGMYGKSKLSKISLPHPSAFTSVTATATVPVATTTDEHFLPKSRFAEGIAIGQDGFVHQLDYSDKQVHKFTKEIKEISAVKSPAQTDQGWGFTSHEGVFYASDGSSNLYVWKENSKEPATVLSVRDTSGHPVAMLNELEYVKGEILANFYGTDCIVRIDPDSGYVNGWIVAKNPLYRSTHPAVDVMNGIAYNKKTNHLYLSGKMWPYMYEVTLTSVGSSSSNSSSSSSSGSSTVPLSTVCPSYQMDKEQNRYWTQLNA